MTPPAEVAQRYSYVVRHVGDSFVCTVVEWPDVEGQGVTQGAALEAARTRVTSLVADAYFVHERLPDVWNPHAEPDVSTLRSAVQRMQGDMVMLDALLAVLPNRSRLLHTARLICQQGSKPVPGGEADGDAPKPG